MKKNRQIIAVLEFFQKPFFSKPQTTLYLFVIVALISGIKSLRGYNNFKIFRGIFWHTIEQTSLFSLYPKEYADRGHYGPLFSLIVAPFAVIPPLIGLMFWLLANALFLYWAIKKLPIASRKIAFIYWFVAHELLTALFMQQFNVSIVAIIIIAYVFIEQRKDIWASFFIVIGCFVKLYGIVGLAFFFFSKQKKKFILSFLAWSLLLFVLPMLISSPHYILNQYLEWYHDLIFKNGCNMFSRSQNISLLGMVRKISGSPNYSDILLIIPGMIFFSLPYLRISQYKYSRFRLLILSSTLLFTVLFSTGSESSGYIIALVGVAIWYTTKNERTKYDKFLILFAFILTSLSPSDLFPKYLRVNYVVPYSLKAFPCVLIWIKIIFELLTSNFESKSEEVVTDECEQNTLLKTSL